jgi:glutathione-regulated potassium-efflux system ancillary protein KefC
MHGNVLAQAFVYLAAAVIVVPVAKRLGLGSVLGYLIGGVALGPFALGMVGREGEDVMHFAEFGVVMMLFLVGLELRPNLLWKLRRPILGMGGLQVAGTAAAVTGLAVALGQRWQTGLAVGLIVAGSSTAIVLQSLGEKGWLKSQGGEAAFSVLLFQDIAVIPILALMPLLAPAAAAANTAAGAAGLGEARPAWLQAMLVLGAVAAIVVGGRFLVRPLFRFLATTRLREIFTAAALTLVIGITLLMQAVGLSPALGTFLAGVVLAESEYRHELEADIEPFKGLLLGVFFIAVGASIDFRTLRDNAPLVLGLVAGIMVVKGVVLVALGRLFALERRARLLLALSLAEVGEFAFVLFSFAAKERVLPAAVVNPLVAVVALSMLVTPLVLMAYERLLLPRLAEPQAAPREADPINAKDGAVVIAGYGRFGQIVGRLLRASGVPTTVLDLDPEIVDVIRRIGMEVHYGDASRLELLHAAGCAKARLFVLAVDEHDKAMEIGATVRKHFPQLPILVRARGRQEYYQLTTLEPLGIVRETFMSAVEMGAQALRALGFRGHEAHRLTRNFIRHDEAAARELAKAYAAAGFDKVFLAAARDALNETERLLKEEAGRRFGDQHAWDNETLRADVNSRG